MQSIQVISYRFRVHINVLLSDVCNVILISLLFIYENANNLYTFGLPDILILAEGCDINSKQSLHILKIPLHKNGSPKTPT